MEFLLPLIIIGLLLLVPIGFLFGRRDSGSGPHPDDPLHQGE